MQAFYDSDVDSSALSGKTIAIIGYGSQGRAHALNIHDSGYDVVVGFRPGSAKRDEAIRDGLAVADIGDAAARGDIVMLLIPDEEQPATYMHEIAGRMKPGAALAFAHGFAIHFGTIVPPANVDVFMVAPKGPGRLVRSEYQAGRGIPALVAVAQNPNGHARAYGMAYAAAIGAGRAGIIETTFKAETETDLFGEQAVLCGGVSELITAGFETLTEAGYAPEMAYFECLHEMKLIIDLMYERGIEGMRDAISNTAKYGDYTRGKRIVTEQTRATMREILTEIQDGTFAQQWVAEHAAGKPSFHAFREQASKHPIEAIGARLRSLMPWMRQPTAAK